MIAEIPGDWHADPLGEDEERAHASRDRAVMEPSEGGTVQAREKRRVAAHRVPVEHDVADEEGHAPRLPEEQDAGALQAEARGGDAALVEAVEERSEPELPDHPHRRCRTEHERRERLREAAVEEERHLVEEHRGEPGHREPERGGEEPEVGRAERDVGRDRALDLALQLGDPVRVAARVRPRVSVRDESHIGRIAPHEEEHRRRDEHGGEQAENRERRAPAVARDQLLRERREDDPARRDAGRRDAERTTAPADEPARHRGVAREMPDARRAERDRAGEAEVERGQRADAAEEEEPGRENEPAERRHRTRAVPVDRASHHDRVAGGGELENGEPARDRSPAAELVRQRREEDAPGVEDHPGIHRVADERDEDDPPAVEDARPRGRGHGDARNHR
jgi:hypothetical protein